MACNIPSQLLEQIRFNPVRRTHNLQIMGGMLPLIAFRYPYEAKLGLAISAFHAAGCAC
jgi:hypothetical protein